MAASGRWRGRRRIAVVVAFATVAAAGAGCGGAPQSLEEFEASTGVAAPTQPAPTDGRASGRIREVISGRPAAPGDPRGGDGGAARPAEAIGFGDGARVAATALEALEGERSLVEVVLYDGYGIAVARAANGDVDRVVVRAGGAEAPSAMPSAAVADAGGVQFGVADVDWAVIPGLVERTPGDLGIEGGTVSHVIVEKNVPFSPDLVIRVYVSTERRSGRIDYFADGRPMRAFPG